MRYYRLRELKMSGSCKCNRLVLSAAKCSIGGAGCSVGRVVGLRRNDTASLTSFTSQLGPHYRSSTPNVQDKEIHNPELASVPPYLLLSHEYSAGPERDLRAEWCVGPIGVI